MLYSTKAKRKNKPSFKEAFLHALHVNSTSITYSFHVYCRHVSDTVKHIVFKSNFRGKIEKIENKGLNVTGCGHERAAERDSNIYSNVLWSTKAIQQAKALMVRLS